MTAITSTVLQQQPAISSAPITPAPVAAATAQTPANDDAAATENDAVRVTLSPPAQAIVDEQGAPSNTATAAGPTPASAPIGPVGTASTSGEAPAAPAASAQAGGGGAVTYSDVTTDVAAEKRKVAAQVGVAAANALVDDEGNTDKIALNKMLAAQEVAKSPQDR
jgi:hypothetical protein